MDLPFGSRQKFQLFYPLVKGTFKEALRCFDQERKKGFKALCLVEKNYICRIEMYLFSAAIREKYFPFRCSPRRRRRLLGYIVIDDTVKDGEKRLPGRERTTEGKKL